MASVNVYSVDGKTVKSVELPAAFSTEYRPDLIHKAVVAELANKRQPYGPSEKAGMRHAVSQWGKGRGTSRVQRGKMRGRKYRTPRSILVVVSEKEAPIFKGVNNLPGVEVVCTSGLSAGKLAPGGAAGRLTVFTESALEQTGGW